MYSVPKIVIILANSADPVEIQHYAAFHLGLYCLLKYLFTCIQNEEFKVWCSTSLQK